MLPALILAFGRCQCALPAPGALGGHRPVHRQERRTRITEHLQDLPTVLHHRANAGDAGQDQGDVTEGADGHDQADMPPLQPLAQDEGVLRPDGDDEPGAGNEAGKCCVEDHGAVSVGCVRQDCRRP